MKVSYPLNKALTEVARHHVITERLTDEHIAGFTLSAEERAALTTGDIAALYDLGANPYLIRRVFRPRFAR
jgi:hypothetical protein